MSLGATVSCDFSGKLQKPPPGRRTKGTDPVTYSGKGIFVEIFTEGRGKRE